MRPGLSGACTSAPDRRPERRETAVPGHGFLFPCDLGYPPALTCSSAPGQPVAGVSLLTWGSGPAPRRTTGSAQGPGEAALLLPAPFSEPPGPVTRARELSILRTRPCTARAPRPPRAPSLGRLPGVWFAAWPLPFAHGNAAWPPSFTFQRMGPRVDPPPDPTRHHPGKTPGLRQDSLSEDMSGPRAADLQARGGSEALGGSRAPGGKRLLRRWSPAGKCRYPPSWAPYKRLLETHPKGPSSGQGAWARRDAPP